MKNSNFMAELKHPVRAGRYLDNARKTLSEHAGKEGNYYSDKKYVKKRESV